MLHAKRTLLLDTTGKTLILGLAESDKLIRHNAIESASHRYHSAILIPEIKRLLSDTGNQLADLTQVITNIGPGSFTGIRTGLTTVRTMAQFLPLSVIALNSFEILAKACQLRQSDSHDTFHIYLDALQGNAYYASLSIGQGQQVKWHTKPVLQLVEDPDTSLSGVIASQSLINKGFISEALNAEGFTESIAPAMLALGCSDAQNRQIPWQHVVPLYLQEPNITLRKPRTGSLC